MMLRLCVLIVATNAQVYTTVNAPNGVYQGANVNFGPANPNQLYFGQATCFNGIAYAQPPVGGLRFQPPQPAQTHSNVYDATYFRPKCPQPNAGGQTSEDCLYLNVYTRQGQNSSMAVMVLIDGTNGFTNGGCNQSEVKGIVTNLVQRDIVVVTVQYRLGALGFFTTYTGAVQSNLGMLDQVEALRWVNSNIGSFGGDPNRITVVGQGDGACAVSAHTLSPRSQNLFNQAIIQSGSVYSCYNPIPLVPGSNINLGTYQAQEFTTTSGPNVLQYDQGLPYAPIGVYGSSTTSTTRQPPQNTASFFDDPNQQLAEKLCDISADQWNRGNIANLQNCLRNYTVDIIMERNNGMNATWMIVRDNNFLPDSINNLASRRPPIPIIIGTVQDEDADYAFKLINTGNNAGSTSDNLNNWLFDFSKRNKLDSEATGKIGDVIAQNYGLNATANNQPQNQQYNTPIYGHAGVGYDSPSDYSTGQQQQQQQQYGNQNFGGQQQQYGNQNFGNNINRDVPSTNNGMQQVNNGQNGVTNLQSLQTISQIASDSSVSLTTTQVQQFWQNGNRHVRIYQFTHVSDLGRQNVPSTGSWKPVFKGQDMYFITMSETVWSSGYSQQDRQVANDMGQRWTDFAKTGQVNNWAPSNAQNYNYCNFNTQPSQQAQYGQNARQIFQDQVNPIVNQAQNQVQQQTGVAQRTNWGPSPAVQPRPNYQPSAGPAQAQYTSYGNGNDRFQVSFQVHNFPVFGGK